MFTLTDIAKEVTLKDPRLEIQSHYDKHSFVFLHFTFSSFTPRLFLHMFFAFIVLRLIINVSFTFQSLPVCNTHIFLSPLLSLSFSLTLALFLLAHVVRPSQFKIRFKLQDWLWLSVVPSEFLPTRNLAFNGILPCC